MPHILTTDHPSQPSIAKTAHRAVSRAQQDVQRGAERGIGGAAREEHKDGVLQPASTFSD